MTRRAAGRCRTESHRTAPCTCCCRARSSPPGPGMANCCPGWITLVSGQSIGRQQVTEGDTMFVGDAEQEIAGLNHVAPIPVGCAVDCGRGDQPADGEGYEDEQSGESCHVVDIGSTSANLQGGGFERDVTSVTTPVNAKTDRNADGRRTTLAVSSTSSERPLRSFDHRRQGRRRRTDGYVRATPATYSPGDPLSWRARCTECRQICARSHRGVRDLRRVGVEVVLPCRPASGGLGGIHQRGAVAGRGNTCWP